MSGDLVATVLDAGGGSEWPRLELAHRGGVTPVFVELERNREIRDVVFPNQSRLVVHGILGSGGDIFTVIDTGSNKIIDTFWGRDAAVSPDMRTAAYRFHTPSSMGQTRLATALVAYDLAAQPILNTEPGDWNGPDERGIVLYPERNRKARRYWILLQPGEEPDLSWGSPRKGFVSPIAWSPDSKRLAVVDHDAENDRLVLIDLSRGLRQPSITLVPIAREAFLPPGSGDTIPDEYSDAYVSFRELRFSEDGADVHLKSWRNGPFAEKTATLPLPAGAR